MIIGDRVQLSALGRKRRLYLDLDKEGVVKEYYDDIKLVIVVWDGRRSPTQIALQFVQVIPE